MFFERELNFLCDVLKRSQVRAKAIPQFELPERMDGYRAEGMLDSRFDKNGSIYKLLLSAEPRTVYKITDAFFRCFIFLLLPSADVPTLLCIGPYLSAPISEQRVLMLCEEMGISPQKQKYLKEYYLSLPVVPSDGHLMIMFTTFCEFIWKSPSFAIVDIGREERLSPEPTPYLANQTNVAVDIKALEMRYSFENQLLRSVSLGQLHMEDRLTVAFSPEVFEKRAADPLRNAKNYSIIMNTLLRKAAEEGGVHPVHLDRTSSDFAHKIENLATTAECSALMTEMFRAYCRLVRRHSLNKYSPLVRRVILTVDADLSADLSPSFLANELELSLGYLSSLFKKETGKTLTEHIRQRRMEHAAYLLLTTDLQIQTVALHCGIMDVQYFSKLFKKQYDMTPSEYRTAHKKIPNKSKHIL